MVGGVVITPSEVLDRLRREARDGTLARLCPQWGIELLIAFGSAADPTWPAPPRDLDLAVVMTREHNLLRVLDSLVRHLDFAHIDLMDLARAGEVARFQALSRGEVLYEASAGTFTEQQIVAIVQHADTRWLREIQLEALAT